MPYCLSCKSAINLDDIEAYDAVEVERNIQRRLKATDDKGERLPGRVAQSKAVFVKFSCPKCGKPVTGPKPKSMPQ